MSKNSTHYSHLTDKELRESLVKQSVQDHKANWDSKSGFLPSKIIILPPGALIQVSPEMDGHLGILVKPEVCGQKWRKECGRVRQKKKGSQRSANTTGVMSSAPMGSSRRTLQNNRLGYCLRTVAGQC